VKRSFLFCQGSEKGGSHRLNVLRGTALFKKMLNNKRLNRSVRGESDKVETVIRVGTNWWILPFPLCGRQPSKG
jgi:hypothetical protein